MSVEGTYKISGRGAVASGTIEQGRIKQLIKSNSMFTVTKPKTAMTSIEKFNTTLDYGEAGDNVGILVRGLTR